MAKKPQLPPKSFEEALEELERILEQIEQGEVGLEESLIKYERGTFLIQHCRTVLQAAEKQIELLSKAPAVAPAPPAGGGPAAATAESAGSAMNSPMEESAES